MIKAIKLIVLILSLANICLGDRIIPDPNFPVLIKYPRTSYDSTTTTGTSNTVIEFRFRLPTRTKDLVSASGIGYSQFIAVRFEELTGLGNLSVGCALSSATTSYTVSKINSAVSDSSKPASDKTIYCQLLDKVNVKLNSGETYTLSLTFSTMLSNILLQKIILFTSSTNNEDAVIFDHATTFGTLMQYTNYENDDNNKIITISPGTPLTTITSPSDAKFTTLYPNFTFDLRVIVKVQDFWIVNPNDYLFYLKYEMTNFSAPNTIDTEALSDSSDRTTTEALPAGQLAFSVQSDGLILSGFKDGDLYPRRSFILVLKGITTKDKNLGVITTARLEVFYRNTYSIVSYSKINMNAVQIAQITASAHHPEYFYMYDGMGWPFQFNFSVNTKFESGGYVVIRHRNRAIETNAINLVASTCDFSLTNFEQSWGKRNNCFPLRNDFNFAQVTSNTTYGEGSGVFFKMSTIAINTEYKIKIWGIIEKCLGTDKTKMYAATLSFTIRIFKSAKTNDTILNESIFPLTPTSENWIMAENTIVSINDSCFGLQTRSDTQVSMTDIMKVPMIRTDEFYPIGREVHNFNIMKPPTTLTTLNAFETNDLWNEYENANTGSLNSVWGNPYYLFGSSTEITGQNLFITSMIASSSADGDDDYLLISYIPSECVDDDSNDFIGKNPTTNPSNDFRIQWLFSRDFLTEGTSISTGCQLNWQYQNDSNGGTDASFAAVTDFRTTLYISNAIGATVDNTYTDRLITSITSSRITHTLASDTDRKLVMNQNMATTSDLSKIDSSSTATGPGATYKITSNRIDFTDNLVRSLSMIGYDCDEVVDNTGVPAAAAGRQAAHAIQFGMYTDCLKWKASPSTVTSIYSYFEMQQILLYNNKYPSRIIRFIKLFPEIGFFHDITIAETASDNTNASYVTGTAPSSSEKWVTGHYETTSSTSAPFAVCLIELNSKIINAYKGTSSNTLVIWLFGASLLDVDVTSETSEYPVAPLASATAYGLNAGQTMSYAHRRIGDTTSGSVKYPAVDMATPDETSIGELEIYFLKTVVISKYKGVTDADQDENFYRGYLPRRTYYQFYLGSTIYIPTSSFPAGSLTSYSENLYIPFLCPSSVGSGITTTLAASTYPTNGVYWTAPIISAAWATMDRYNSVSKIDNYIRPNVIDNSYETTITNRSLIQYATLTAPTTRTPIQFPIYRSPSTNTYFMNVSNPRQNSYSSRGDALAVMKVQFRSYALNTTDDSKTLVLTNISAANKKASAFSIFLNSSFDSITTTVTNSATGSMSDNNMKVKTLKTPIYILGKPYTRFLAYSYTETNGSMYGNHKVTLDGTDRFNSGFTFTVDSAVNVINIPRLAISNFDSKGYINPLDFLVVFTNIDSQTVAGGTLNKMLSNLKVTDNSGTVTFQSFLLWHPELHTSTSWSAELVVDITDKAIKEDRAGNIRISGTFPTEVPMGSEVKLTFTNASVIQASSVTICGLYVNTDAEVVTDCTVASPVVTCKLNTRTNKFKICCYNIYNDNSDMKVNYGQLYTSYDTSVLTSTLVGTDDDYNQIWYSYPADTTSNNLTNFNFTSRSVDDITETNTSFFAKVTSIGYRLSSSENGFGLAIFTVELPRNAARGMTVKITGDLARLKIANIPTRIVPSFGNSGLYGAVPEAGDLFLEYIYSNFDTSGIVLKLKNMIYRCGLSLSSTINVTMWPVLTSTFNAVNLTVSMVGPGGNALAAAKAKDVTSTSVPLINHTIPVSTISNDFCSISSISPRIVDEYATYNFTFNFSQFATTLEGTSPNEVIILLPHLYYEDYPEISCLNGSTVLQCNYIEKSMLSIRFPNSINISGDTSLVVSVIGLVNPYLTTNNGVYFGCAITKADYLLGTRNYLLRGTTTLTEGIIVSGTNVTYGNIVFKNSMCKHTFELINSRTGNSSQGLSVAGEEVNNPREDPPRVNPNYRSVHEFGFVLDIANNALPNRTSGFTLTNSPVLYITFPSDYKFNLYTFTPSAEIMAYETSELDLENVELIENFITVNSVEQFGNQLKITFTQTSFTFDKYFQFLKLRLFNLPVPVDNTENTTSGRVTTESFRFSWINSDLTMIFRTFRNLNNFSNIDIIGSNTDKLRVAHKGLKYVFDQRKWVVDIQSADNSNAGINYLPIKAGIYNRANLKVRTNSRFIPPAKGGLVIDHNKIKISGTPYVVTALQADVMFLIGLPCDEQAGMYYVLPQFRLNDPEPGVVANPYLQFMPFAPLVVEISNQFKGVISFLANYDIRINGSTFVDFSLSDPAFTDITLEFKESADSVIDKTTIFANKTEARTVMRITNPNASAVQSYELGVPSNSCYEFQWDKISFTISSVAAIIPNDAINQSMFEYRNADTDNTITDYSTIRFNFVTEYTQIYVYAALACFNDDFPTDEQMKSQNVTSTPRLAFYSEILNIKGSAVIDFASLIRGNAYKLKVLIESTQGDKTLRTSSSMTKLNQTLSNGTIVSLMAGSQVNPLCASYRFKSRPGIQVTNPLLWYWQSRFSEGGYEKTGCVTAVDQYGTNIPGLPSIRNETSCGRQNCRFIDRVDYVVNQTQKDNSETYIICAYPYSTCTTNPSDYVEKFNTLLNELNTNITVNVAINAFVVPEFTLTTTSDSAITRTPTITELKLTGNKASFTAVADSALSCFVKPITGAQPAVTDFDTCSSGCTVINVANVAGKYEVSVASAAGTYNLYAVCYNDMPCSDSRTSVVSWGTVTVQSSNGNNNGTNNNGTDNNGTNNNSSGYHYFTMSLLLLLALIMFE